jgi:arylsulfatase A-like enzyme
MTNIALVVLDTLRKDRFDQYFDWLPGLRFDRAFSTANWTVPAHASLFTGLYPSETGVHSKHTTFDYPQYSLTERLSDAGYRTRAFSANTNITGHFDFDRGFDEFHSPDSMQHLNDQFLVDWREFDKETEITGFRKNIAGLKECLSNDANTVQSIISGIKFKIFAGGVKPGVEYGGTLEALKKLNQLNFGENEFLFLNLMEAHEPYSAPEKYQSVEEPGLVEHVGDLNFGEDNRENQIVQAYDDCSRYLSNEYENLYGLLQEEFDYIITLSDHGEMLGEHGMWGHEYGLFPELTHVPLVISGSEIANETCNNTVSLVDVFSTVLDLAEVEDDLRRGQNLLEETDCDDNLIEYHGLTAWSEKKLREKGFEDQLDRYDSLHRGIATEQGYYFESEAKTLTEDIQDKQELKERLVTLVDRLDRRKVETDNEVPDEIKSRLEDLGYA